MLRVDTSCFDFCSEPLQPVLSEAPKRKVDFSSEEFSTEECVHLKDSAASLTKAHEGILQT